MISAIVGGMVFWRWDQHLHRSKPLNPKKGPSSMLVSGLSKERSADTAP